MEERPNKRPAWARRKFFINEHFQLHFVAFCLIVSLAASVFFYVASSWFFMKYNAFAIEVGMRPSDPFFKVLYNMEMMLTNIFIVTSVAVVLVSIIGGVLFSHKIAGPMYRLRMHMDSVAKGETLGDVGFRKNDYFGDVAQSCNAMLATIRQRLGVAVEPTSSKPVATEVSYQTPIEAVPAPQSPQSQDEKSQTTTDAADDSSTDVKKAS